MLSDNAKSPNSRSNLGVASVDVSSHGDQNSRVVDLNGKRRYLIGNVPDCHSQGIE